METIVKIRDYIQKVEVLEDPCESFITLTLNYGLLPKDGLRKTGFIIDEIVRKYDGRMSIDVNLYSNEEDIATINCAISGDNHQGRVNLILSEIYDTIYPERRIFPISVGSITATTTISKTNTYFISILVYNTITQKICDEINKTIKDFCGITKDNREIQVHSYLDPIYICIYFNSLDAAIWFHKTIKLIEQTE